MVLFHRSRQDVQQCSTSVYTTLLHTLIQVLMPQHPFLSSIAILSLGETAAETFAPATEMAL